MAIVTSKFRVSAASSFVNTFAVDNMYLVLARPQSWSDTISTNFAPQSGYTPSDLAPPTPIDNHLNEYALWRDAMAALRITAGEVKLTTRRYNWVSGTKYDMYRHDISPTVPTANGRFNLSDANSIVYVTGNSSVYKCLYNGTNGQYTTGIVSTVAPITLGAAPQTTADGYIWKYMYTITAGDADFITNNYIPVPTNGQSSVSNTMGIDVIVVTNGGSYSSAPVISIYGDGTGAAATAVTSAGVITAIQMTAPGSGYTWAKIAITASSTNVHATAVAIIAPARGHGANLPMECHAHNVMVATTVSGFQDSDVPVNQDFRTVAVVRNPLVYQTSTATYTTSTVNTANTAKIARTVVMSSTATTAPTADIVLVNTAGAQGIAVFQSSTTVNLQYIAPVPADTSTILTTDITRIDIAGTKQLKEFANGNVLTGTGYSETVSSTTLVSPEMQPYSGELMYLDYRQPVTRNAAQNEKINIVINF